MTKREKRLQKIRQNPKTVSLQELQQVLEDYGFWLDRVTGSHHIFRAEMNDRNWKLAIPFSRPIKIIYVKQAIEAIDQIREELSAEEEDDDSGDN